MTNSFDKFSILFTSDTVYVSGKAFPLGQHSTDILNLDDELLTEIEQHIKTFLLSASALRSFQRKNRQRRSLLTGEIERCLGLDIYAAVIPRPAYGLTHELQFVYHAL